MSFKTFLWCAFLICIQTAEVCGQSNIINPFDMWGATQQETFGPFQNDVLPNPDYKYFKFEGRALNPAGVARTLRISFGYNDDLGALQMVPHDIPANGQITLNPGWTDIRASAGLDNICPDEVFIIFETLTGSVEKIQGTFTHICKEYIPPPEPKKPKTNGMYVIDDLLSQMKFTTPDNIQPGASLQFTLQTLGSLLLKKHLISQLVQLDYASIDVQISSVVDSSSDTSSFVVTGGSGQFAPYVFGGESIGTSSFTIEGGTGSIHWELRHVYAYLTLRVTAPGWSDIIAYVDASGSVDFVNDEITFVPGGAVSSQINGIPTMGTWALIIVIVLLIVLGTHIIVHRRTIWAH